MHADKILEYCDSIDARLSEIEHYTLLIRQEVAATEPPGPPLEVVVPEGGDLQAALDAGGLVALEADATFTSTSGYSLDIPGTALRGQGRDIVDGVAPAFTVPVGARDVAVETLLFRTSRNEVGFLIGRNDGAQVTVEAAPRGVRLEGLRNWSHRGKRAVEINAGAVDILGCEILDCYDPGGLDNQALWVGNAPGPVTVIGGTFEAASENFLVGGDAMKIPNCRPTGITIRDAIFVKPLAWKDAGTPPVKNLIELKDGHDVLIERCALARCWKSGQDGYAFMFTPTRGGSLRNVVVRDCTVREVGAVVNITGFDSNWPTPHPRTQVTFLGGSYQTDRVNFPGPGRFALVTRGPEWLKVEGASITHQGSAFIDVADKVRVDELRVVGSTWNYGSYGIRIGGLNHGDNSLGVIGVVQIEGNTITGAHSLFRARYPNNTYLAAMTRAGEQAADATPALQSYERDLAAELERLRVLLGG